MSDFDVAVHLGIDESLEHEGVLRRSGRYPWGSGATPHQRNKAFMDHVNDLKSKGLSDTEIAKGMGITTTQLRAAKSLIRNQKRQSDQMQAMRLKEKGVSNPEIAKRMGLSGESQVRALLNPMMQDRADILTSTTNMLRQQVDEKGFLDIGVGQEHYINGGVSNQRMKTAIAALEEEGYKSYYVKIKQVGTGKFTNTKVLVPDGVSYPDVMANQDKIRGISAWSDDGGRSYTLMQPPLRIDPRRVSVRYKEEGGDKADGVIEIRRGVDDLSMGQSRYAQVRVAVGKGHYLKGMAMYADDLPDGVDIRFNTNKSTTGNKLDAMKKIKDDPEDPFGTVVRQRTGKNGKVNSALNIVNEEGNWNDWSSKLSSQFLSKQTPQLAKEQLGLRLKEKQAEFDEIMSLTNPAVRKRLLDSFADDADSSAVHLKAAGLPRTKSHVILPINSLKDTEIYAPNYRDGEKVVLVRHPHGGIFEIPELTVNNKNRDAQRLIQNAVDAVGINSKVASRLSGADFDGDTVLVIPNNNKLVKSKPPLQGLKDFDPMSYKNPDSVPTMKSRTKQLKMGDISNLITDMTIKGANDHELAAAVRHSMVVIDAEKHNLNWQQSAKDNNIASLKKKYQTKPDSDSLGASTLISRASSPQNVPNRKPRSVKDGGPIDINTGEKKYTPTGESYVNKKGKTIVNSFKSTQLGEAKDARSLSSGRPIEEVYATYSNALKSMANEARKTSIMTKTIPYSPSAKAAFSHEVASLNTKLKVALRNAPLERQAQLLANTAIKTKREATPDLDDDKRKKEEARALTIARARVGAKKVQVEITADEWKAIQAGAISNNTLSKIMSNTDLDKLKTLATPRERTVMSDARINRAKAMLARGATQADVASALGVPVSTLNSALNPKEGA